MDKFLRGVKDHLNVTTTENGAVAHLSTKNDVVDLFGRIGAMRSCSDAMIIQAFQKSFDADPLVTAKMLFYARDIRGGLGERRVFRVILNYLGDRHPEIVKLNLHNVVMFGRYDDLLCLVNTRAQNDMLAFIKEQFEEDLTAEYPTLLGKWLPSENASSDKTKQLAVGVRQYLGLSSRNYRKSLSMLRKRLNIIERQLSSKEFGLIDYSKIPSKAAMQYRQSFYRNDEERYTAYLDELKKPAEERDVQIKVNADTLFPYDIVRKVIVESRWNNPYLTGVETYKALYNAQWEALPNYLEGIEDNSLCVVDTSGSMTWNNNTPISSALALGIYSAQRNKGRFHNYFMTFSSRPELVEIKKDNLWDIVKSIRSIVDDTNIEAVFDLLLTTAIDEKLSQEDLPSRIIIISDMQFNRATGLNANSTQSLFRIIRERFERAGYTMPRLVFWNVEGRDTMFPMTMDDNGIQFVSGHSAAIFEAIAKGEMLDPFELVLSVVNKERYDSIVIE